jgi:hypothetical protein
VKEAYKNFTPAVDAATIVQKLLDTVPEKYLRGLGCVLLTNETALSRRDRVGRLWKRRRKYSKSRVLGRYHGSASPPYIELRVDKIIRGLGAFYVRFPFFRDIVFGHVLFHEVGHHIHRTIRPEYTEKEDVADTWARKLNSNFLRRRYWYAVPLFKTYALMRRKRWA